MERGGKDKGAIQSLGAELSLLMARLAARPVRLAIIGDAADQAAVQDRTRATWSNFDRPAFLGPDVTRTPLPGAEPAAPRAFTTATQVNYCALALSAPAISHPDAAPLSVAARYLGNAYLHQRIREKGGAYGSRAAYSASLSAFTTTSYRDPRLADTFADMRDGFRWLATIADDERHLREAVLRALGRIDEALAAQRALLADHEAAGSEDGFVHEELAECLTARQQADEARPHFARAHELLSADTWFVANEGDRLARLVEMARAAGTSSGG